MAEDEKSTAPEEVIGNLTATPASPADIADVVNPANADSPASDIANKVIENVQPAQTSAQQAISDALGNPVQEVAPKLQDAVEQPAELLKPGREVGYICSCALFACWAGPQGPARYIQQKSSVLTQH